MEVVNGPQLITAVLGLSSETEKPLIVVFTYPLSSTLKYPALESRSGVHLGKTGNLEEVLLLDF